MKVTALKWVLKMLSVAAPPGDTAASQEVVVCAPVALGKVESGPHNDHEIARQNQIIQGMKR